jgi:hypothetical protein
MDPGLRSVNGTSHNNRLTNEWRATPRRGVSVKKRDNSGRTARSFHRLLALDYVRALRRNSNYGQMLAVTKAFEQIFPAFNNRSVSMMTAETFNLIASDLGFSIKAAPYEGRDGLALRGFYTDCKISSKTRPLLFVNTAHHPLVVTTTFMHELAHHVTSRILRLARAHQQAPFETDYPGLLRNTRELMADSVVSLAGYPTAVARRIFGTPWNGGLVARAETLSETAFVQIQQHLKRSYGFDLMMSPMPENQHLHYLSGMIHYAKLRWALLVEYDL